MSMLRSTETCDASALDVGDIVATADGDQTLRTAPAWVSAPRLGLISAWAGTPTDPVRLTWGVDDEVQLVTLVDCPHANTTVRGHARWGLTAQCDVCGDDLDGSELDDVLAALL